MKFACGRIGVVFLSLSMFWALLLMLEIDTAYGEIQNPRPRTDGSLKAGETVFFEYCSGCHGRRADGRGPQALNLMPKPKNLRNGQFIKHLDDERLYTSISGGVRGTAMPAFEKLLTENQRWDVISYVRSLTASDSLTIPNSPVYVPVPIGLVNPIAQTDETYQRGRELFVHYCASCHGEKADGTGEIGKNLVPAPRNLAAIASWGEKPYVDYMSDDRLFGSITNGIPGTSMAAWNGVLTEEDRWHLLNFLRGEAKKGAVRLDLGSVGSGGTAEGPENGEKEQIR